MPLVVVGIEKTPDCRLPLRGYWFLVQSKFDLHCEYSTDRGLVNQINIA